MSNSVDAPQSPVLIPPTSVSPGIRATALQKVFNDALDHTLRVCTYSNFASCFPTPAKHVPDSLDGLHRDFISRLGDVCKHEFIALMQERAVTFNLNKLDDLIVEARKIKQGAANAAVQDEQSGWRAATSSMPQHLITASDLLTAHTRDFVAERAESLSARILTTQRLNMKLYEQLQTQRVNIREFMNFLENVISDVDYTDIMLTSEAPGAEQM